MADGDRRRGDEQMTRWVSFELAGQLYGLPILDVQEVLASAEIEPVPGSSAATLGVINLRGTIVTVLDLRLHLGLPAREAEASSKLIVLGGAEPVALRVDRVATVRAIADGAIKPLPETGAAELGARVRGLFSRNNELLTLLDSRKLL